MSYSQFEKRLQSAPTGAGEAITRAYCPEAPKPVVLDPEEAANAQAAKMLGEWLGSGILETHRLGLIVLINFKSEVVRIRFDSLASSYLKVDFGPDAVRPKSSNTIPITEHIVLEYLVARWGEEIAEDINPLEIQRWLLSLHTESYLVWTALSKMRGIMSRIYKVGLIHEKAAKNPVEHVQTRSKTNYRAVMLTPKETIGILKRMLNPLHYALVLTCAATALRASEILALRWFDICWAENRIRASKRWSGGDGDTKTESSEDSSRCIHCWRLRSGVGDEQPIHRRGGFRISVPEDEWQGSTFSFHFRPGLPPSGGHRNRDSSGKRTTVRPA